MREKNIQNKIKSIVISFLVTIMILISLPVNTAKATTGGTLYVANYVVVDLAGNELTQIKPGDTCSIAVTLIDARTPIDTPSTPVPSTPSTPPASSTPVSSLAATPSISNIADVRIRLNPGAFTIPSVDHIVVHQRTDSSGYFSYTVVFNNITYVGGAPTLSFDVTYVDSNNNPLAYPLVTINQNIGQAVDTSVRPEVILRSSSYGGSSVTAGQSFTLSTNAYNTSPSLSIENVIVTVKLPDALVVSSGSSSVSVGTIAPNGTISASFALQVKPGAESGSVPVTVEYTYYAMVHGKMEQFISTQIISVPVVQRDRFEIYDVEAPEVMMAGEEVYVSLGFANKGKGIVYNVSAEIEGDMDNPGQRQFLGNIAAGSENSVDFYITASEIGTMEGTIVLTYENASGEEITVRAPFSITVEEASFIDPGFPPVMPEQPVQGGGIMKYVIGVVLVAGLGGGGFYFYKKKKASDVEAEDEDEDF